jgi:pyruvate dehydrogenase E2 component (dihydrolipoamide acetyltransferase)
MAEKVLMLALSPTMESGTIANWTKKEGDSITNGDILCEVETDKATMEYEAIQEGTLLKIIVPAGAAAVVEQTIAIIGAEGDDISALVKEVEDDRIVSESASPASEEAPQPEGEPESPIAELIEDNGERKKASPLARKMAAQAGIVLSGVSGSGPGGRIVKKDITRAKAAGAPAAPVNSRSIAPAMADEYIPVSGKRKVIAERLAESKYSAPHFYLKMPVFTESLMEARKALNDGLDYKVSVNAFLIKFAAEALKRHPVINSSWEGDKIHQFGTIDIALAVAQEDGLVTPVVRNCGAKGITEIDNELSALISRAKENKLTPEDYTGATFTISSLGTFGVDEFTAIINPPGSAILAVGQMQKVPVVGADDELIVRQQMKLTLSCDHRVIDGAKGAEFLQELKLTMENPVRALY